LLLLETKDWKDEVLYIPNLEKGNGYYDYTILVRINPDGENIMKANKLLYVDIVDKEKLREVIFNELWSYDVPGYISNNELKILIGKQQIIPQNALLNGKITMDAENYYEETGNLNDCRELIKNII